jgi:hypothetical protein
MTGNSGAKLETMLRIVGQHVHIGDLLDVND